MLYFIPNIKGVGGPAGREALLRQLGLSDVLRGASMPYCEQSNGPGGLSGIVVDTGKTERAFYEREKQTWCECDDGAFWCGYWNEHRPGPETLARESYVEGYDVALSDGNKWIVPLVRVINGTTRLPQIIGFAKDGKTILNVHSRYKEFYEMGLRVWENYINEARYAETREALLPVVIAALGVNYRVGKWECGVLGLLDTVNIRAIAHAMIDGPTIDEYEANLQKKTDLEADATPDM